MDSPYLAIALCASQLLGIARSGICEKSGRMDRSDAEGRVACDPDPLLVNMHGLGSHMYLGIEVFEIAFGMLGSAAVLLVAFVLRRGARQAELQDSWQRRLATTNALALPLDQRKALRTAFYGNEMSLLSPEEEVAHYERVVAGLEVAEHIAFCINNRIYDPEIAIRMFGRTLEGVFLANLRLVYEYREVESERMSDSPRATFYELERFVRDRKESLQFDSFSSASIGGME